MGDPEDRPFSLLIFIFCGSVTYLFNPGGLYSAEGVKQMITHKRSMLCVLIVLLTIGISGCGSNNRGTVSPQVEAPALQVLITETSCPTVEVAIGEQVVWSNMGAEAHVVQSEPAADGSRLFSSGELQVGDTFTFTFTKAGEYVYQCTPDGRAKGSVIVKP